jgi:nicotinate phosphoribosyltransferase
MLDDAGFERCAIVASNDLDEHVIRSLKGAGARIGIWGVGTRLATAFDQPALGCVYKLSAIRSAAGQWQYRVKLSEQMRKTSTPGILQVRRYRSGERFIGDVIFDEERPPASGASMVDPVNSAGVHSFEEGTPYEHLLTPSVRGGRAAGERQGLERGRARARGQLRGLSDGVRRLVDPERYPVGLEAGLHALRDELSRGKRGAGV